MADLLASSGEWLSDQLQTHLSRTVTYRRGADSVSLTATVGRTLLRLSDPNGGVRMEWTDRDYMLRASDLVLSGSVVEPARGDLIDDATDGKRYEVSSPRGEAPWRYGDHRNSRLRIHVKEVGDI